MSIVLKRVLKTTDCIRLSRKYHDNPVELWRLREQHQRALATSAQITTSLSQELVNMKVAEFPSATKCLDTFEAKFEKLDKISVNTIPPSLAIGFLKTTINGNIPIYCPPPIGKL